mmetsp:Transcript_22630/g.59807  ORF Transcript_22630/g.59807 Transcript_22630/m.59807 type:complete len:322 (-) Transcript_22630:86-1051(-)
MLLQRVQDHLKKGPGVVRRAEACHHEVLAELVEEVRSEVVGPREGQQLTADVVLGRCGRRVQVVQRKGAPDDGDDVVDVVHRVADRLHKAHVDRDNILHQVGLLRAGVLVGVVAILVELRLRRSKLGVKGLAVLVEYERAAVPLSPDLLDPRRQSLRDVLRVRDVEHVQAHLLAALAARLPREPVGGRALVVELLVGAGKVLALPRVAPHELFDGAVHPLAHCGPLAGAVRLVRDEDVVLQLLYLVLQLPAPQVDPRSGEDDGEADEGDQPDGPEQRGIPGDGAGGPGPREHALVVHLLKGAQASSAPLSRPCSLVGSIRQ